jgi:hypothetical protein
MYGERSGMALVLNAATAQSAIGNPQSPIFEGVF